MPPKSTKHNKDVDTPAGSNSQTVEAMTVLLEQHRNSLYNDFKSSLGAVDHKLDQVCSMVEDFGKRISSWKPSLTMQTSASIAWNPSAQATEKITPS